jgi:hypothetical protein
VVEADHAVREGVCGVGGEQRLASCGGVGESCARDQQVDQRGSHVGAAGLEGHGGFEELCGAGELAPRSLHGSRLQEQVGSPREVFHQERVLARGSIKVPFSDQEAREGVLDCVPGFYRVEFMGEGGAFAGAALAARRPVGTALLRLDDDGFARFSPDVPTFWATAPTDPEQSSGTGFALNADFDLDIGRSQLATSPENQRILEALARALAHGLTRLDRAAKDDWGAVQRTLGLGPGTTRYGLWLSFWKIVTFGSAGGERPQLLERFLWDAEGVATQVICGAGVLPTQLPGPYRCLVLPGDVLGFVEGRLAEDRIFLEIASWTSFQERYPIGTLVAPPVGKRVQRSGLGCDSMSPICLLDAVQIELGSRRLTSEVASRLGRVVGANHLGDLNESDLARLERLSASVEFLSVAETWEQPDRLVTTQLNPRLSAFAPASRRVSEEYDADGLEFLRTCRRFRHPDISTEDLQDWARSAATRDEQQAVLIYLVQGERWLSIERVLPELQEECPWLRAEAMGGIPADADWGEEEERVLRSKLAGAQLEPSESSARLSRVESPRTALRDIFDWWTEEGQTRTTDYERAVYGGRPCVPDPEGDWSDPGHRRDWITLLSLGALHRLGWTLPGHHGGFLKLCRGGKSNWLDVFATRHPNHEAWGRVLEEYFDTHTGDTPHLRAVEQIPAIFQLSRELRDYGDGFLDLDLQDPPRIENVVKQKESAAFSGTDFTAAPVNRILGLGGCFVVRELVRGGALSSSSVYPLCYVASKRVRNLARRLGGDISEPGEASYEQISRQIHSLLVKHLGATRATFGLAFDLPLSLLALKANSDLQELYLDGALDDEDSDAQRSW